MRRAAALVQLSREHHTALVLAQRARLIAINGDGAAVASMAVTIRERFAAELKPHFDEEERWLLPALAAAGEAEQVKRTLAEHAELIELTEQLATPCHEVLLAFADCLSRHVRFEERDLFVVAESHPDCLNSRAAA